MGQLKKMQVGTDKAVFKPGNVFKFGQLGYTNALGNEISITNTIRSLFINDTNIPILDFDYYTNIDNKDYINRYLDNFIK